VGPAGQLGLGFANADPLPKRAPPMLRPSDDGQGRIAALALSDDRDKP
jgi:hypothetical protein